MGIRANHTINFIRNITFEYICLTYKSTRFTTSRTTFINSTTIQSWFVNSHQPHSFPQKWALRVQYHYHKQVGNSVHLLAISISAEILKCFPEFGGYNQFSR